MKAWKGNFPIKFNFMGNLHGNAYLRVNLHENLHVNCVCKVTVRMQSRSI